MTFIVTSILLTVLLVYLARWIPTTRQMRVRIQIGIIIAFIGGLTFLILKTFSGDFREHPFSVSDANEILEFHNISLNDEFELSEKKISGVMDYNLEFELLISESDKSKIVDLINRTIYEQSNLNISNVDQLLMNYQDIDTTFYFAYEKRNTWNLEFYHKLSNGYIRTQDLIELSKETNALSFIRLE